MASGMYALDTKMTNIIQSYSTDSAKTAVETWTKPGENG